MEVVLNKKKTLLISLLILGLLLGAGAIWGYENYKDEIAAFLSNSDTKNESNSDVEDPLDTPYFASDSRSFIYGEQREWQFYTFQPEIIEYRNENGLNIAIGEYAITEDLDPMERVKIILTTDEDWAGEFEGVTNEVFSEVVTDVVRFKKTHDMGKVAFLDTELISLEDIMEKFPVGSRMAISIPLAYPREGARTESSCVSLQLLCAYADVIDTVSIGLDFFNGGDPVPDLDNFYILPYTFTSELFKWSESE